MRRGAHGAVFAGGIDGRVRALFDAEVLGRPAGDGEFGVAGRVTAGDAVAILEANLPLRIHQQRAERLITSLEGLPGQVNAAAQVLTIGRIHSVFLIKMIRGRPPAWGRMPPGRDICGLGLTLAWTKVVR